jgi:thiol-disulfide isomerase/thioredoxin
VDIPESAVMLIIYGRKECHLCLDMISALNELQTRYCFQVEVVDVDSDAKLLVKYGERVPVLMAGGEEICHFHLDPSALDAYFDKIR